MCNPKKTIGYLFIFSLSFDESSKGLKIGYFGHSLIFLLNIVIIFQPYYFLNYKWTF